MVKGLGSDIIEIKRVKRLIDRYGDRFLHKTFTPAELEYCMQFSNSAERFAGRFAAKEAISKALGTGMRGVVTFQSIEILTTKNGKPEVHLSDKINATFGWPKVLVTISHSKEYALAYAIHTE